ncbi:MAG: hypothetical protein K1X74_21950 [Pirellulales bacterium]|nr:hypothetical protein [Pirellulales bacterium]
MKRLLLAAILLLQAGCSFLPLPYRQPVVHNPFPQLTKVAVAPFFNLSTEASADGRMFALSYFNELQAIPGFEVIPIGVVEQVLQQHQLHLESPADARRLAQLLGADCVVVGAITDFSEYYPPRCGLQVEWYAANPCYHPIPPGYGLPWGSPEEDKIPKSFVFDAEHAKARAELAQQTPPYQPESAQIPLLKPAPAMPGPASEVEGQMMAHLEPVPDGVSTPGCAAGAGGAHGPPPCQPSDEPVLRHTRIYHGHDSDFTNALVNYAAFRDDARFGGWQSYLQRKDDFIRFCCHLHITEMLSSRGGAEESRVVWRCTSDR